MRKRLAQLSPLGWRLVATTVAFSTLVALLATAFQLYIDYRRDLEQIESTFEQVGLSYLPTIANALWATNRQELQVAINGLARLPDVRYVAVKENEKTWAEAGRPKSQNIRSRDYLLTHAHRGETITIGGLTVVVDMAGVYQRLLEKFWVILITNGVKTFLVAGFMLWLFHWLVTRHLHRIAEFAARLGTGNLKERLALARPARPNAKADEFDLVLDGLTRMQSNLAFTIQALEQDITERKRLEVALQKEGQYRSTLYENTPIGLALCRMDGSLIDVNPAFAYILGRSVEETLTLSYWDITPKQYAAQEDEQLRQLESTGRYGPYEKECLHQDGHLVPVRLNGLILTLGDERLILSSVEDITERKLMEDRLRQQLAKLMRWQEVMLGREDRVQELKKEVNDLLVRLGQPVRYPSQAGS